MERELQGGAAPPIEPTCLEALDEVDGFSPEEIKAIARDLDMEDAVAEPAPVDSHRGHSDAVRNVAAQSADGVDQLAGSTVRPSCGSGSNNVVPDEEKNDTVQVAATTTVSLATPDGMDQLAGSTVRPSLSCSSVSLLLLAPMVMLFFLP